jgi:hypothetical protein
MSLTKHAIADNCTLVQSVIVPWLDLAKPDAGN